MNMKYRWYRLNFGAIPTVSQGCHCIRLLWPLVDAACNFSVPPKKNTGVLPKHISLSTADCIGFLQNNFLHLLPVLSESGSSTAAVFRP